MVTAIVTRRAVGYARVSTVEQAGERHSSLETQEARIRAYADAHGLAYQNTFTDVLSGRRDDRQQYRRMVDAALGGDADVILVQYLDRFGRNPREILRRIWELGDHKVTVEATDEDIREEMVLLVRAGLAGAESRRNSERVRANMARAAGKGRHFGRPPYGYRSVYEGRNIRWEQAPAEAEAVREMVRLSTVENLGFKSIADRLTAAGIPTRTGKPWAAYTVQSILTNESLTGTLVYGKGTQEPVRIPGFFPAILAAPEWAALLERLAIRRESPRGETHASSYLLSGIARCGHCGGPVVGKVGSKYKGRQYRNYWCSNALRGRAKCGLYNGHSAPKLERAILEYLGQYSDPQRVRELLDADSAQAARTAERDLRGAERRLETLDADFHKNLGLLKRGILTEEEFNRANLARRGERAATEARLAELRAKAEAQRTRAENAEALPVKVKGFLETFQGADVRHAKAQLQTILKAAHVFRDGRIELEFRQ